VIDAYLLGPDASAEPAKPAAAISIPRPAVN
jgi:hypothetical protein